MRGGPALPGLVLSLSLGAALCALLAPSSASAGRDRERPSELERPQDAPRPCKCIRREPPLHHEALTPGPFAELVIGRAHAYDRGVRSCLRRASAASVRLSFTFRAGAADPRVRASGSPELAACIERLTWHSFESPARAATVDVRISDGPAPLKRP